MLKRLAAVGGLVIVLLVLTVGRSEAIQAGEFCRNDQLGVVATADNGATVTCLFDPAANQNRWKNTPGATATTTSSSSSTTGVSTTSTTRPTTTSTSTTTTSTTTTTTVPTSVLAGTLVRTG